MKLPRANVKDQNPHTQKHQIDVKRGNMSMDGSPYNLLLVEPILFYCFMYS